MKKYTLGTIVFLAGTITMVFEIAGSRVLGPFFGTSIFVWTSLIGIVMGSLSLGYWLGGQLSVKKADTAVLSWILMIAAFFILITAVGNNYLLSRIVKYIPDFRIKTVVSSIVLFGPASVFLGMVLPYIVKLKILNLENSGASIGNLYALSTIGSIGGTFLAGFILLPVMGFANILFILPATLCLFSILLFFQDKKPVQASVPAIFIIVIVLFWSKIYTQEKNYLDVDTQYNRVIIYNTTDKATDRPIKMLLINDERSSAMYTDTDSGLVFEVLKYYKLIEHFKPDFNNVLMIGGSGYAFPKYFLRNYPGRNIDVVEIDPELTSLAKQHFNLPDSPYLNVYHEDGRTFLNRRIKKYDAVLMDAYKSVITVPFQLTTKEAIEAIYDNLSPDGIVLANIISSLTDKTDYFLRAELATYKSVFPQVLLFAVMYPDPDEEQKTYFQNFMLVGLKTNKQFSMTDANRELNEFLSHKLETKIPQNLPVLTDEYAPVEYYTSKALK
jgi:spermidine synthase